MTIWWFYLVLAFIIAAGSGFIWITIQLSKKTLGQPKLFGSDLDSTTKEVVEHIFNDQFREELKNRGRLQFEKIINDSAEFLQQDLRLTSSQLNEYMKNELTSKVHEELTKYEQSINDARDLAIDSIKKTSLALDEQRQILGAEVQKDVAEEKVRIINNFINQLSDIVSHYITSAIGSEIDLNDQLDYILANLETNKQAMIEDIKNV
jgi:hypothetical protein